ncbi:MAG: hypothetical protein WDZ56_01605 [Candidatus Paceibacterota bacterium]
MDESLIRQQLLSLKFVHMFFVGTGTPKEKRYVDGREIWCDTRFTAVIERNGEGIALLGFHLSRESLFVEQIQGIKGVNSKGCDLGPFLILCAEKVARLLGKANVCIQPANRNSYWDLDEEHRLYPQLYAHQARMKRRYDLSAKQCGYDPPQYGYNWWHKTIRKRITFARWLRLQEILFNRSARNIFPFFRGVRAG